MFRSFEAAKAIFCFHFSSDKTKSDLFCATNYTFAMFSAEFLIDFFHMCLRSRLL